MTMVDVPYVEAVEKHVTDKLGQGPSEWCLEAVRAVMNYLYDRYGRFPIYYSTFHSNLHAQVHHVDCDFYDKYLKKGSITTRHRGHFDVWHD